MCICVYVYIYIYDMYIYIYIYIIDRGGWCLQVALDAHCVYSVLHWCYNRFLDVAMCYIVLVVQSCSLALHCAV